MRNGLTAHAKDGSEWGLAIIVSVGNNWIEKLIGEGSSTADMDAPLVKLFEFLVSALCLLIAQDMGQDGEVLEAQDDKVFERAEDGSYWGVQIRPSSPTIQLSPALNGAVDLMVKLMSLRATVASRIVQLATAALWNICKVDLTSQRYMLQLGLAQDLIEIPHCTAFPPLVRANACMLLAVLAEHLGNIPLIPGGLGAVIEVAVHSINTKVPVLEQRGAVVLGRLSFRPPMGSRNLRDALNANKEQIARKGGIRSLVQMMRYTHQRLVNIESRLLREEGGGPGAAGMTRVRVREDVLNARNLSNDGTYEPSARSSFDGGRVSLSEPPRNSGAGGVVRREALSIYLKLPRFCLPEFPIQFKIELYTCI